MDTQPGPTSEEELQQIQKNGVAAKPQPSIAKTRQQCRAKHGSSPKPNLNELRERLDKCRAEQFMSRSEEFRHVSDKYPIFNWVEASEDPVYIANGKANREREREAGVQGSIIPEKHD